jgi:hypothetical protein
MRLQPNKRISQGVLILSEGTVTDKDFSLVYVSLRWVYRVGDHLFHLDRTINTKMI